MKYFGMPMGMWGLFSGSFRAQMRTVFGYDAEVFRDAHGDVGLVFRLVPGAAAHGVRL